MSPLRAPAYIKADSVEIRPPTEARSESENWCSRRRGVKPEAITIHTTFLGGGFGRRLESDYVVEAVETSRAAGNAPVKVVWTREDDTQHSPYRPASYNLLSAALDSNGMPVAWRHRIVGASILQYFKTFGHLLRNDGLD